MPFNDRGSLWSRWDLHFHTPTSFDYKNGSITNEQIVEGLRKAGVSAVAITDHHVIDVPRIHALQKLAGNALTVLPGIEFRTELGGKEKVHLIGIFPEDANLDELWTKLSGKLEITPEDVKKKTHEAIYVDFKEAAELIRNLGGIVTTHAGGKSNSIENIGNNTVFKMALKTDLAREFVDIYEVGKLADRKGYEEVVFPAIGKVLPLIMGSDNHDITHYEVKAACWIKGDPSFRTFQQLISDPQRAFLGETPVQNIRIDGNPTKYVSEIQFVKKSGSKFDEDWFSGNVKLNPGLVAIIGNKGSGKTALAEAIGLLGNCTSADAFSFLNEKKFRQPRNNKAKEFEATLTWRSQHASTRSLDASTDENAPAAVSYIPQSYLELICNEVNNQPGGAFDKELKSVIFSHVSEDKKLGTESLDALLAFHTEPLQQRLDALRGELTDLNRSILELEQRSSNTNRQMLLGLKESKDRELEAHEKIKPEEVTKPDLDPVQQDTLNKVSEQIATVNQERDGLNEAVRAAEAAQRTDATKSASTARVLQQLRNFEASHKTLLTNLQADCDVLGLNPKSLVSVIVAVNLDETILSKVNQGRRGSFAGVEEGKRALKGLVDTADLQTAIGALVFANTLLSRFRADHRQSPPLALEIGEQLKSGTTPIELLDAIFGLKYLSPKYQLKWSGKSIEELSPGERGTLLLIFYLLIDRRDVPLIIDQPEDNLDNQTVYDMLVACLREARQRRQVIIVTHNPNLAVVCDADQIIHSHIDKQHKNKVTYTSGSLENPKTNTLCITVLEGTRPAFVQRDRKYQEET